MYVLWREEEWWKWVSEREKESKRERNKKERVWERKQKKPWMKERVRECEWEWEREREREMFCDWKEGGVFSLLGLYGIVCFFKRSLQWLNTKGSSHHLVTSGSCQPFPIIFYFVNRNLDPTFICLHSFETVPEKVGPLVTHRVARWHILNLKSQFLVNYGWSWNGKCMYILWPFGLLNGHLVYFIVIGILRVHIEYFSLFWYVVPTKKNLATLVTHRHFQQTFWIK
jgi:hypothetical protein